MFCVLLRTIKNAQACHWLYWNHGSCMDITEWRSDKWKSSSCCRSSYCCLFMPPRSINVNHLSSWFIHSVRFMIFWARWHCCSYNGLRIHRLWDTIRLRLSGFPLQPLKYGRSGGVSYDPCFLRCSICAQALNCSTEYWELCFSCSSLTMASTSLIFSAQDWRLAFALLDHLHPDLWKLIAFWWT